MTLDIPDGIATVTVRATYRKPDGLPFQGTVTFVSPATIQLSEAETIVAGQATATLDAEGSIELILVATDNANMTPTDWVYRVTEQFKNDDTAKGRLPYSLALPQADAEVDLAVIAPSDPSQANYVPVVGATGAAGAAGADGSTTLSGNRDPVSGDGIDGDYWMNTSGGGRVLWGPKASGAWPGSGVNLVGGGSGLIATINGVEAAEDMVLTVGDFDDMGNAATRDVGTTAGTVAAGDDPRFAKAWLFDVVQHAGAVGDGLWVNDAAMTAGSQHVTSDTGLFTVDMEGMAYLLHYSSATGDAQAGTLVTYVSPTEFVLSVAAGTTVSDVTLFWGTDNTPAYKTTVADAHAHALAHGYSCEVYTPLPSPGDFYMVAGALDTTLDGNAQIPIPATADTGTTVRLRWRQEGSSAAPQSPHSTAPAFNGATIVSNGLFSSQSAQGSSIDHGNPCVIGGPAQAHGYGQSDKFSNTIIEFSGTVLTAHSKTGLSYCGLDFTSMKSKVEDTYVGSTGCPGRNDYEHFTLFGGDDGAYSIGILLAAPANNDYSVIESVTVGGGFSFGIVFGEHTDITRLCVLYCSAAVCPVGNYYGSAGSIHSDVASLISVEACTWVVRVFGKGSGGVGPTFYFKIDYEGSAPRFGDRNSGSDMGAARGRVELGGTEAKAGLILDGPPGFDIIDTNGGQALATADYDVSFMDQVVAIDASGANVTAVLPTPTSFPQQKRFTVVCLDTTGHTAKLAAPSGHTLNGAADMTLTQWDYATVAVIDGEWVRIG
jgi:hypothetical protein